MTLAHWNRAIDVNLRGVVHGVVAAYPVMIAPGPRPHREHGLARRPGARAHAHPVRA